MGRKLTVFLSVPVLAVAVVWPLHEHRPVCGDTNGDHRVDVLDIQAVFVAAVEGHSNGQATDIDGNGQTDVVDYQLMQALATASPEQGQVPKDSLPLSACHFAKQPLPWPGLDHPIELVDPAPRACRTFHHNRDAIVCSIDSRTVRYLYRLTSNAPPST